MFCLSSKRPIGSDANYDENQYAAWQSWQKYFSQVVYFNEAERALQSPSTLFVPSEPFPKIWQFVEWASHQSEWCAIVNSDIVIGPNWIMAQNSMRVKKSKAITSWRYEFVPGQDFRSARVVDPGIDFFAACPEVWRMVLAHVPENLRIGCQQWDSWMLGALGELTGKWFHGITNYRCIFHPKHGGRQYGGDVGGIKMMRHSVWPDEI